MTSQTNLIKTMLNNLIDEMYFNSIGSFTPCFGEGYHAVRYSCGQLVDDIYENIRTTTITKTLAAAPASWLLTQYKCPAIVFAAIIDIGDERHIKPHDPHIGEYIKVTEVKEIEDRAGYIVTFESNAIAFESVRVPFGAGKLKDK